MDFTFTDQQLEFRDQLRAFTDKECDAAALRRAWASPPGWSRQRWQALAELGVVGLTVPAEHGGLGLGQVDLVLLLQEAGWAALPEPLLASTALAAPLLVDASGADPAGPAAELLAQLAAGTLAAAVPQPGRPVADGVVGADLLVLERHGALYAVSAPEAQLTPVPTLDPTVAAATVGWDERRAVRLLGGAAADAARRRLADRAAVGSAAVLVGLSDRMLAMATTYACDRRQFGVPVGSFQAVKHQLADARTRVEFARPLVERAAWSLDHDPQPSPVHASMAKAAASDAATVAARTALQVHGAVGYTWEHDLHLWMKRAWHLAAAWGDAGSHRARVLAAAVAARHR